MAPGALAPLMFWGDSTHRPAEWQAQQRRTPYHITLHEGLAGAGQIEVDREEG